MIIKLFCEAQYLTSIYCVVLIESKQRQLEEIGEYYECCQENLKCRTAELEDAKNIIDSMQEKMIFIENELAAYKTKNVDHSEYN